VEAEANRESHPHPLVQTLAFSVVEPLGKIYCNERERLGGGEREMNLHLIKLACLSPSIAPLLPPLPAPPSRPIFLTPPLPPRPQGMESEHSKRRDSDQVFSPGNYDLTTTPVKEWGIVTGEEGEAWAFVGCVPVIES